MADLDKLVAVAKAEIVTNENPVNSNKVKYNTWYYSKAVPFLEKNLATGRRS